MNKPKDILLYGNDESIDADMDGLFLRGEQEITDEFLTDLAERRHQSTFVRESEFMHVAEIPAVVVDHWKRNGFDIIGDPSITAKQIVSRLKAEGLDAFLATNKKV